MQMLKRIFLISLLAGVLGGGGIYYGFTQAPENRKVPAKLALNQHQKTVSSQGQSERAFKTVRGNVVSVINLKTNPNGWLDWLGLPIQGSLVSQEGSGLIYQARGRQAYVVTNAHVVSGARNVQIILNDGHRAAAKVVGKDDLTDLAVLKINSSYVHQIASFGNSNQIQVGEPALAIGSPLGSSYASSLTKGIISAKHREVPQINHNNQLVGDADVIQTDTAINPGNSGGPLINLAGQVIGINSMKFNTDDQGVGIEKMGFAIPSNEVVRIINQIVEHGRVMRPKLGIEYLDLSEIPQQQRSRELRLPSKVHHGSVLAMVKPHSSAAKAGLRKNDVIVDLAGRPIFGLNQLRRVLYLHKVGDVIPVTYYHQGQLKRSKIKLASH